MPKIYLGGAFKQTIHDNMFFLNLVKSSEVWQLPLFQIIICLNFIGTSIFLRHNICLRRKFYVYTFWLGRLGQCRGQIRWRHPHYCWQDTRSRKCKCTVSSTRGWMTPTCRWPRRLSPRRVEERQAPSVQAQDPLCWHWNITWLSDSHVNATFHTNTCNAKVGFSIPKLPAVEESSPFSVACLKWA